MKSLQLNPKIVELGEYKQELQLPVVIKDKVLLSPGTWNGINFSAEEIKKAFHTTDWTEKKNYELIYDHETDKASSWLGNVVNLRVTDNGVLIGDLEIWDSSLAQKLVNGKAKMGISARVLGVEDEEGNFVNFTFNNFSVVGEPACREAYINLSKDKLVDKLIELEKKIKELEDKITTVDTVKGSPLGEEDEEELKKVTAFEEIRKKMGMSVSEFYAIPRDPPSESKLPIFDAAHVRNALARFNQIKGVSEEEKKKARTKIISAAKKFGIKVSKEFSTIQVKGGNDLTVNMEQEEKAKIEDSGEVSEESKEEPKEEPKKESGESEEKSEDSKEETSEGGSSGEESKESEELSSKIDAVLKELQNLQKSITELVKAKELSEESNEDSKEKAEELSQKKDVKPVSLVETNNFPKGYSRGEVEFAEQLLSQVK